MRFVLGLIGLLFLAPMLTAATPTRDWSATATMKPDGAYVIGNPAARVKLMEWASYTCSHCAHFEQAGLPVLVRDYVRPGRVSIEFRHAVRDGFDMAAEDEA
jgi:protein-disulfide isomerase